MIINEDFFDSEEVSVREPEELDAVSEKNFTHTIVIQTQMHNIKMPVPRYDAKERARLGSILFKFETRLFKCLDLFDIDHSEHFMLSPEDYINLKDKELQSYEFGRYVLHTEPTDENNCMYFYCYVDFSNIPLKKFIKFFNMCSVVTAQLSKFSADEKPWVVCAYMYEKNEDSPCVNFRGCAGILSNSGTPQNIMKKEVFFYTI